MSRKTDSQAKVDRLVKTLQKQTRRAGEYKDTVVATPKICQEWLETMVKNRNPSRSVIDRYKATLQAQLEKDTPDDWKLTGDTVKFDKDGHMFDGQHRCIACIETGIPFITDVRYGLDPEAFKYVDQNRVRTAGQIVAMEGHGHAKVKAAAVKVIKAMDHAMSTGTFPKGLGWSMNRKLGPNEILTFIETHEALLDEATTTIRHRDARVLLRPPSTFVGCYFVLGRINLSRTRQFFQYTISGEMLTANDPIARLRQELMKANSDTKVKRSAPWKAALLFKAWNYWMLDEDITQLRFRTKNEKFPKARRRAKSA